MQAKIKRTGTMMGTEFAERTTPMGPAPFDLDELRRRREVTPVEGLEVYSPPQLN
jgi:NADH-quinone oxidoreductase subunit B